MNIICRLLAVLALTGCGLLPSRLGAAESGNAVPKGNRLLGIAVTEPEQKGYDRAVALAKSAGMQVVSLKLNWDDIEKKPGVFDSPWPKIANAYYPRQNIQVSLRLATLDTTKNRLPPDLRGKPFDDPAVIARFNRLLDYLFEQMPDVKLTELSIGNEVDGVLGNDAVRWEQYTRFFTATRQHAREKRPGLKVGVSVMFTGHVGATASYSAVLNQRADVVMVSYYPLTPAFKVRVPKVVVDDFDAICKKYPNRPVSFVEAGYPSGGSCASSEARQRQFVDELFAAWDRHADQIGCITFVWLTDASASALAGFQQYYGVTNPAFVDYLGTLGLRTFSGAGQDKLAFTALQQQAHVRGWQ